MSILNRLASSQDIRNTAPNIALAEEIAEKGDKKAVEELVANLGNKDRNLQSDCIKTLYEIGEINPKLIARYAPEFVKLLDSKNNRLVWGAMTALSSIGAENAPVLYDAITKIVATADAGTVITKDHAVKILAALGAIKEYKEEAIALLLEQILASPVNQLPSYAEKAMPIIDAAHKAAFLKVLHTRLPDLADHEAKRKRMENVIKKMS